jgi:hypothetical protein
MVMVKRKAGKADIGNHRRRHLVLSHHLHFTKPNAVDAEFV